MNAFNRFNRPDSTDPKEWAAAVEDYCQSMPGQAEVQAVLAQVQHAMREGALRFERGNVPQAVDFVNGVMKAVRQVDGSVSAWSLTHLVPSSVVNFVQPNEAGTQFAFQPMYTL